MNTVERIREAKEILETLKSQRPHSSLLVRAHGLLETALGELFQEDDDVAALGQCFPDDDVVELDLDV